MDRIPIQSYVSLYSGRLTYICPVRAAALNDTIEIYAPCNDAQWRKMAAEVATWTTNRPVYDFQLPTFELVTAENVAVKIKRTYA